MSDDAHSYQTEVPVEHVETTSPESISNALVEKATAEAAQPEKTVEPNAETSTDPNWDAKFAALSRKEKEMRERESALETRLAELEAKLTQPEPTETKEPELPLEYRLKRDPIATLGELGLDYETLTNMVLNDGRMSPEMQMKLMREELESDYKSKFEELEAKLADKEIAEENEKYNQVINNFKTDLNNFIESSDEYELIKANEAQDLVYDVIEQYHQEHGRILDTSEAADQVEKYLEDELRKVLSKSKKLGNWNPESAKPVASTTESPTLSNSQAVTGATQSANGKMLSREESLANLAHLIKWDA